MTTAARAVVVTNPIQSVAKWALGFGRALMRLSCYLRASPRDWWLLSAMNDDDLQFWASQGRLQRRYALARRRYAVNVLGRPIRPYPRSTGRSK